MPLTMVKSGTYIKILSLTSDRSLKTRLLSLGIFKGAQVRVLYSDYQSPILVEVFRTQIALSQKVAENIIVETIKNN